MESNRPEFWTPKLIEIINTYLEYDELELYFVIDKRYSNDVLDSLYLYIEEILPLESLLGMKEYNVHNIVDINDEIFEKFKVYFTNNLYGNNHFKFRLFEELHKFRLFNKISEQKIFSVFICGNSGIGKTESARILHNYLSPNEKFIKINL